MDYTYEAIEAVTAIETAAGPLMLWGPMGWWYWFGAWIAIILSLFLIWWAFIEAYRQGQQEGQSFKYMKWPSMGVPGFLLQVPALFVSPNWRADELGISLAMLGMIGFAVVGAAMIAYFSKASASRTYAYETNSRLRTGDSQDTGERVEKREKVAKKRKVATLPGASQANESSSRQIQPVASAPVVPAHASSLDSMISDEPHDSSSTIMYSADDGDIDGTTRGQTLASEGSNSPSDATIIDDDER